MRATQFVSLRIGNPGSDPVELAPSRLTLDCVARMRWPWQVVVQNLIVGIVYSHD